MVKHLHAMWETQVRSLGLENPLDEGNGNLLQQFCLGNPMDRGTWQAIVHEVAVSDTTEHSTFIQAIG